MLRDYRQAPGKFHWMAASNLAWVADFLPKKNQAISKNG
jgi:hypothetical protein